MSTPQDDPAEQLLDLLVYAPLGLLLEARDLVPKLAEKGRRRLGGQVTVARMVGELAVRRGQRQAEKILERLRQQNSGGGAAGAGGRAAGERAPAANGHGSAPSAGTVRAAPAAPSPLADAPTSASLAIPGYDTLSASQVLPRLEGLSAGELEAVRAYEQSTRARKTVLSRIDQLRDRA